MIRWTTFLALLIAFQTNCFAETPESLFERGVEAYKRENWPEAISDWEKVVAGGWVSGQLYYNLGNAHYRNGEIGEAIVYYLRAERLMPRDKDVKSNLELARMATVDRVEAPIRLVIWNWIDNVRDSLSVQELARLIGILGLLAAVSVGLWIIGPRNTRRVARTITVTILSVYLLGIGWYAWRAALEAQPRAVVLPSKVDVFSAPDSAATLVFTLHEGTTVRSKEVVADWVHIVLGDGRWGWLPRNTVEEI